MGTNRLKEKLQEQQEVYASLKEGDTRLVCYKESRSGEWGIYDANDTNRLRLAYYLLYWKIEDEGTIAYLFREELKDREHNSFQGIGNTIRILTWLLRKYNADHKYDGLFVQAKNANFDCLCGYDVEEVLEEDFESISLLDGIYLCQELKYKDVMGGMVDEWKSNLEDMAEGSRSYRRTLIDFNAFLGRDRENEELYQNQLAEILSSKSGRTRDIISGYRDLIRYYLHLGNYEKASQYCRMVIETIDYQPIRTLRMFGDILEGCMELAAHDPSRFSDLWEWTKKELQNKPRICRYGNLYTKGITTAEAAKDPYAEELEREYWNWRRECSLDTDISEE